MASPLSRSTATRSSQRPMRRARRATSVIAAFVVAITAIVASSDPAGVDAACGSFQSRVDHARSGSTITIPRCTFHEAVTVRKPLTINAYGATIDGQNQRSHGVSILASDVTINGLTVTRIKTSDLIGAIWTTGVSRFTLRDAKVNHSATVCLSLNGGSGHRIVRTSLAYCGKEGYFANGVSHVLFKGDSIYRNNSAGAFDPSIEAGGGKIMASSYITFDHNKVWKNGGPGIWFDNGVKHVVVRYNRVRDNQQAGIFFEISSHAKIYGNSVWGNGFGYAQWGYGAGITISSSDDTNVYGNTVAWNARGISVLSQARELSPHTDNRFHDNVIISKHGSFVAGFYDDHGGGLFAASRGNRGYDNRYWIGGTEPSGDRFQWNGPKSKLSAFNATLGEARGRYISTAKRNAILRARGMPLS
jgi:nitrous oxidase accessory protein NosD